GLEESGRDGYLGTAADPRTRAGVPDRDRPRQRPSDRAVGAADAVLQFEDGPRAHGLTDRLCHARLLVGPGVLVEPGGRRRGRVGEDPAALELSHLGPVGAHPVARPVAREGLLCRCPTSSSAYSASSMTCPATSSARRSGPAGPARRPSPTPRSSPSNSSASSLVGTTIRGSSSTSAGTTPPSSRPSPGSTAPPSPARPPTCTHSSTPCTSTWPPAWPPGSRCGWWTACRSRRAGSPGPSTAGGSRGTRRSGTSTPGGTPRTGSGSTPAPPRPGRSSHSTWPRPT